MNQDIQTRVRTKTKSSGLNQEPARKKVPGSSKFQVIGTWLGTWFLHLLIFLGNQEVLAIFLVITKKFLLNQEVTGLTKKFLLNFRGNYQIILVYMVYQDNLYNI